MKPKAISERWTLQGLLPGKPGEVQTALGEIESCLVKIEAYRSRLTGEMPLEDFLELLHTKENLQDLSARLGAYAYLSYSENTQDPAALSLRDQIDNVLIAVQNRSMFFGLWFKSLSDEEATRYISAAGDLSYFLQSLRRFKPYTLSEAEEKIINLKDLHGSQALVKIYEIITNGFTFNLEVDGELKTLTRDGLARYYHHPLPEVRLATYAELYRVYGKNKTALAQIYSSLVHDWKVEAIELRGYSSPIAVRNLGNDLPDAVVDTLLEVCRQNSRLFQRYFKLKARLLGMERLRRYDIYAPIASSEKSIRLESAIPLILDSFQRFSPQVAQAAARVLDQDHLDAEPRPGKRAGAFSYSVTPKLTPWVLVNYSGRLRDVTTLAHELGHSVHTILAGEHSILTFHAPLPLAETASVFAEMLITDRLLQEETNPAVQRDLLITILDNAYATVQRQAFISIFEKDAHQQIAAGCTSEELAQQYMQGLSEQFGEAVALSDEFAWEWITIPHIYSSPFYTYAYSFGQLLVLALYRQYLSQGETFTPRYLQLLSYGGSAEPCTILAEAGLDIAAADFWQGGFDVLQSKLERLEGLAGGAQ
jgi:oligoendopeptidase F